MKFPVATVARWSVRLAAAAACLGIVALAGSKGLAYWSEWRNAPTVGTAILESNPPGSVVSINGTVLGPTPLTKELEAGRHRVQFQRRSETRTMEIDVVTGQSTTATLDWNQRATGGLQVRSDPEGARVLIDGRERGVTPLTIDAIPVGSHAIVLESDRGTVRKTVTVKDSETAVVQEAIFSGWIGISSPIELDIRSARGGITLDERHQALIAPGSHTLQFENKALGFRESRQVDVKPGEVTRVSIEPPPSTLTVTASVPAEVVIDGKRVGDTPLNDHPVTIGTHDVALRDASGAQRYVTVTVKTSPARVDVDFSKP